MHLIKKRSQTQFANFNGTRRASLVNISAPCAVGTLCAGDWMLCVAAGLPTVQREEAGDEKSFVIFVNLHLCLNNRGGRNVCFDWRQRTLKNLNSQGCRYKSSLLYTYTLPIPSSRMICRLCVILYLLRIICFSYS